MNDALKYVDELARRARQEETPHGDVTHRVMQRLHESDSRLTKPLILMAAGYAAAASVAVVYGLMLLSSINSPLSTIFHVAAASMP